MNVDHDVELPFSFQGGYYPNSPVFNAPANTGRAGSNVWVRANGKLEVANGVVQTSATNVGARAFQFNTQRATIAGALVSGRLPYAGLLRYQNAVMLFLSELTGQQVYLDETAVTGLTTSSTVGQLRVGVPGSPWSVYDAGFDKPILPSGNVAASLSATATKGMNRAVNVSLCAWRTSSNAISAPAIAVTKSLDGTTYNIITITLPSAVSGQDGWIFAGSRWGDTSGDLRVVRYVRLTARGTFTCTNGSVNITAGTGTYFQEDLRPGDVVTISGTSYTIATVTGQTTATLTTNFLGTTGAGKTATITAACAEWYSNELGDLLQYDVFKPVPAAGIFNFANQAFLWGCYGSSGSLTGPCIVPLLFGNSEHIGLTTINTSNGDDILNVFPAENKLYILTPNTLEAVYFTANADFPFRVRILYQPGFKAAMNGIVFKDRFYGYSEKPIRTSVDDNMDDQFGIPVWSDMKSWDSTNVVLIADPKNDAILYCYYSGGVTTCIPYMTNLEVWGFPMSVSGQIVDSMIVNGTLYLSLLTGGNYRVYQWEGGSAGSASTPYACSQFQEGSSSGTRKVVKGFIASGMINTLKAYRIT